MINIIDKSKCCGCRACYDICPNNSIEVKLDKEGFYYPSVNNETCLRCDLCNKVCPIENNYERSNKYNYFFIGGYNKNKDIINDSSSGGIFWLLVEYIISCNGVVYGVELGENFHLFHNRATNFEECKKFRKSKYLESNTNSTFRMAKQDLENNLKVLYSGTPCQIAGLYSYLGKEYKNLYTCDVVCHGVPSKVVFDKYINELNITHRARATSICWRDKETGWNPNNVTIYFDNSTKLKSISMKNSYQKGFLINLFLRPSCYNCLWAKLPRIGDISLADFWGYSGELLENNLNGGLSIIVISSIQGENLFNKVKEKIEFEKVTESYVTKRSRHVYLKPAYNEDRKKFFEQFETNTFEQLTKKYINKPLWKKIAKRIAFIFRT